LQFAQANAQSKNCKRACFANVYKIVFKKFPNASKKIKIHRHAARKTQKTMTRKLNIEKAYSDTTNRRPAGNSTYPKGGVSCSNDSSVVNQTLVFQIKFCGKSPALRVAANRYGQVEQNIAVKQESHQIMDLNSNNNLFLLI
jgi:hypothetical protein